MIVVYETSTINHVRYLENELVNYELKREEL